MDFPRGVPVRHYSILEYARFRWFKAALALCALAGAAYLWHEPPLKPYGGTWLGYTLGTIGAVLIVWLMWYGVRKRRYLSTVGTVQEKQAVTALQRAIAAQPDLKGNTWLGGPTTADVQRMIDDSLYAEQHRLAGLVCIDTRGITVARIHFARVAKVSGRKAHQDS